MKKIESKRLGVITPFDYKKPKIKILYWGLFGLMCVIAAVCMLPPLWVLLSSFKDTKEFFSVPPTIIPKSFKPEKVIETWNKMQFWRYYVNSLAVVGGCVFCAVTFNCTIAYVLSCVKPRGHKVLMGIILWSLMIPSIVALVPLFSNIVNLKLINTYIPLWLLSGASAFYIVVYKNFFDSIPGVLIEAARIDGCSDLGILFKIMLPLTKSINMVVVILTINSAWSDFLLPFLVLKNAKLNTVMVKIFNMTGAGQFPIDQQFIALTFAIIPPVILFLIFQKQIMEGFASTGIKG